MTEMQDQLREQNDNLVLNAQQQPPKKQKKCSCKRFEIGQSNPYAVGLILGSFQVLYALLTGATNNLMVLIVEQLNIDNSAGSWIANIEILGVIITIPFVSKVSERFGMARIFSIGTLIFTIFNIMFIFPFIYKNYAAILVCKAIESIGLGFCLPTAVPMSTFLVARSKVGVVVSVISLLLPVGNLVSSLVSGYVGQYLGFQYMYFIGGVIALIDLIFQVVKLPYSRFPSNKNVKIDFIGSILLAVGLLCIILGFSSMSGDGFMPLYACIILVIIGFGILIFFFYYNLKLSKFPIFNKQVFNQSTICAVLPMLIGSITLYAEKYVAPYTYKQILGMDTGISGIYLCISATSTFVFSPLTNYLSGKIILKRVSLLLSIILTVSQACICIITYTVANPVAITIFEWFSYGSYVGLLVTCQSGNMMSCPKAFTQQIGILNQISQNLGHSVGIVVALLGMQGFDGGQITKKGNGSTLLVTTIIAAIIIIITFFMGVYSFERGKKGFSETQLAKTKTFDENYQHSQDLVETQEFSGEEQQSKGEKLLSMFNMWM